MDIQLASFILGIVSVLVIAMSVVSVYALVKVVKLRSDYNGMCAFNDKEFRLMRTYNDQEFENLKKELDNRIGITYRDMDSRCDKLYEKIMKNKNPRTEMFEMADKDGFRSGILQILNKDEEGNGLKDRILELINKTT